MLGIESFISMPGMETAFLEDVSFNSQYSFRPCALAKPVHKDKMNRP